MISWKTVEDEAGLVKREAGPMYKSKGCTIVFPRKYSVKVSLSFIYDRKVRTVKVK